MAVIADKCPNIKVEVVDVNQERISDWNNKDFDKLLFMNLDSRT